MGSASRRKKARKPRKHGLENQALIISESTLREAIQVIDEVRNEIIDPQESPQLPDLPENKTNLSPCPTCWSTEACAVLSETIHWGEWRCVVCDRHRGWIENPANTAKREDENQLINRLLQVPGLGSWEKMFLRSIERTRKRSPRQIQKLNEIASKAGFAAHLILGGEA